MNVVLIGMKHCGKSTLGKALAARWGCAFYDVDEMIESTHACETEQWQSVRDILTQRGDEYFHKVEGMVVCDLYMRLEQPGSSAVVALGGRTALNRRISELLAGIGLRVYLQVSPQELWRRVQRSGVPPFLGADDPERAFLSLCRERQPEYERLADLALDLEGVGPEDAVDRLERRIQAYHQDGR